MRTTRRDPLKVPAVDLVGRDFDRENIDELWIGDAIYISTDEGWLYLATIIDACSRRLLGWSITDHLRTELCLDAIQAAVGTSPGVSCSTQTTAPSTPPTRSRRPADRFASDNRWEPSVTVTTTQWPSLFFSSFKREDVDGEHFATRAETRAEIFAWLNWYNTIRLHSSLDFCPPIEYEEHPAEQSLVA
jgi:transposase InsO family protein